MKALVISDRKEIIDFVTPLLKNKGFDLIHYRWIIKALDNVEEIQPDVIVLSAMEYPRHWKTLAGFVQSGIGGNDVKMYLYDTTPLSKEDSEKAGDLGVISFEEAFKEQKPVDVELALNDPLTGKMKLYSGKYYSDKGFAEIDFNNAKDLEINSENCHVKYVSLYDGNSVSSYSAELKKDESNNICLYFND